MRLTLLAVALACGTAGAQEWRTLDVSRQLRDTSALTADITYGAGTFTLGPASGPDLYEMHLRYPAGRTAPVATYDAGAHDVHLGIKSQNFTMPGSDVDQNELHIGLARGVPLNLTTEVAAADVKIDLGGLAVRKLRLKTGATDATLAFSTPNTTRMESMVLNVAAAGFKATGLANANANHIVFQAGLGDWDLYFDGTWTGDITLDAKVGLGSLNIHVPDGVRVEQNANAVLGAVTGDNDHVQSGPVVTIDNNDDEADSSDAADSSDDAGATAKVSTKVSAKVSAKVSEKVSEKIAAKVATPAVVMTDRANATTPRFTLHIVGRATLGEITFDHKLAGAGGQ